MGASATRRCYGTYAVPGLRCASPPATYSVPVSDTTPRPVDALAEQFVTDLVVLDPLTATYAGIAGHDHRLPDLSPDGYAARTALTRKAVADVRAAEPVDAREEVAKAAFLERNQLELELDDAGVTASRISVITSALHDLRETFDLIDTSSEAGWAAVDARLAGVPDALEGYRRTLLAEADRGHVSARPQLLQVAAQTRSWTGAGTGGSDFFRDLATTAQQAGVPTTLAAQLSSNAAAASQAVAELGRFLADDLTPRAPEKEAVGRELYALHSRYFLGAAVDLDETYAWGWEELARLDADRDRVVDLIVPGGSLDDAVAALDAQPGRVFTSKDAFREWMQELADRTLAELADTHFDIPEPVRRIECCIAPTDDGGVYYTGPSEDFSRPGRMWWSVPAGQDSFSTWREVTTVFHEGVPGHHLQIGQTAYRTEQLNRWQRLLCWVSGHGEGWALYAERLMDELGYLDDAGDKLGMLDAQAFRAARVVVDIGMHLELEIPANPWGFHVGERWTPELGLEFMLARSRMSEPELRFEVQRYLGWPGQAPSYKVGERIWLQAREDARIRQGDAFDLKAFHRAALDLGSLGLDPLRDALARL